jgi:hypothetical protein
MAVNELVMSTEDIAAELGSDTDVADSPDASLDNPDLDSDAEIPNSWEDAEGDNLEADDDDTPAPAKKKQAQTVKQYKANGKVVEVDLTDQARVDQLITLGLGARQVFSERDSLKKANVTKDKTIAELSRYKDLWTKLEGAKGDHDALYEKIFGRTFDETYAERKQQREEYEAATPEERRLMDLQKKFEADRKAWEDRQKQIEEREKKVSENAEQAERKEIRAQLLPEFYKYEFSSKVKDPEVAEEMNAALWRLTVGNLKKYEDLSPDVIRKEFAKVAKMLSGSAAEQAKTEVKKITEEKKKASKQQAQVASTRNYAGTPDVSKLSKEKDPVKLFRKMFG